MTERLHDPVNYVLDGSEPDDPAEYTKFLDRLTDVPESASLNRIEINEAGITNQQVYVKIDDMTGSGEQATILCDLTLAVDLHDHRGIHMSRCEEALFDVAKDAYPDLDAFSLALAQNLRDRQRSKLGIVKVKGIHLYPKLTRKSGRVTHDKIILLSEAIASANSVEQKTGLTAYNMTACPCTRTYTKFSVVPKLKELGYSIDQINQILNTVLTGTHTQRGTITVVMDKKHPTVSAREILTVIDKNTHLVNELLKRPDEHDLVVRALQRPQFTEDVVRDIAFGLGEKFGDLLPSDTKISIESILLDSIHIHDVRTLIRTNIGQIKTVLSF